MAARWHGHAADTNNPGGDAPGLFSTGRLGRGAWGARPASQQIEGKACVVPGPARPETDAHAAVKPGASTARTPAARSGPQLPQLIDGERHHQRADHHEVPSRRSTRDPEYPRRRRKPDAEENVDPFLPVAKHR